MIDHVKSLKECIVAFRNRAAAEYDSKSVSQLLELIQEADLKMFFETAESERMDAMRAVLWFANVALTRKGLAPSARRPLGAMPTKVDRLGKLVRKQDGPYYDLQWLGARHPDLIPEKWRGIRSLAATAPGSKSRETAGASDDIVFFMADPADVLADSFDAADRLINRQMSVARKCQAMKLTPAIQSEMRWLCSASTRKLLKDLDKQEMELRNAMKRQGIKQLKQEHIDRRIQFVRAWKLAGGGTNWQATADVFAAMTGETVTRQAIKDMISRLGSQKLVRLRHGRRRTHDPVLGGE